MKDGIKEILNERQYCCEKVQKAIDKHIKLSLTDMEIRNMIQIILRDEFHPINDDKYFVDFAKQYDKCITIKEMKEILFIYNQNDKK